MTGALGLDVALLIQVDPGSFYESNSRHENTSERFQTCLHKITFQVNAFQVMITLCRPSFIEVLTHKIRSE